ncbi:hypothetical protein T08_5514 [Trichinella sp. T8]|nr:hypothetical protein T08_5514 [Trichinella sp. T8]
MVNPTDRAKMRLAQVQQLGAGNFGPILFFAAFAFKIFAFFNYSNIINFATSFLWFGYLLPHWVAVPYLCQLSPGFGEFTLSGHNTDVELPV